MREARRRFLRRFVRVVAAATLVVVATETVVPARAGQAPAVATLSLAIDVQGSDGLPPDLGTLGTTGLLLGVDERACGGPSFVAEYLTSRPATISGPGADQVTVVDSAVFRVDVEVPVEIGGTDCEYTVDVAETLLCYQTVDVVADGPGGAQELSAGGVPTGDAVSPASGDVVAVMSTYTDRCSDLRLEVAGLGDRRATVAMDLAPVDPADRSQSCDLMSVSPQPMVFASGVRVLDSLPAGCAASLTVSPAGCTVSPSPDQFVLEHPLTVRQLTAVCAAAPAPGEPSFTG